MPITAVVMLPRISAGGGAELRVEPVAGVVVVVD
jgi:hypothetical protein